MNKKVICIDVIIYRNFYSVDINDKLLEQVSFRALRDFRVWRRRECFFKRMNKNKGSTITSCIRKHVRNISSASAEEVMKICELVASSRGRQEYFQTLLDEADADLFDNGNLIIFEMDCDMLIEFCTCLETIFQIKGPKYSQEEKRDHTNGRGNRFAGNRDGKVIIRIL